MIIQKFYPIYSLLIPLQNLCMQDHKAYFKEQFDLDSSIVSERILSSETTLLDILEKLSLHKWEKDVNKHIQSFSPEQRFLLFAAIATVFVHYHADTERLPLFPEDNIYPLLFAYIKESYLSFKGHCEKHHLDIWWELLDYVVDSFY